VSALGRWTPVGLLLGVGLVNLRPMGDPDFWWLLRGGRYMVETRSFPVTDPFSATAQGAEWLNHAWGFELLLYGAWALGGMAAVVALQGLFAAATFGVLYALLRREGAGRGWATALVLLGALATHGFWDPRPQLVTYLLLALFVAVLADFQAGRADRLRWLPALTVVWVNCHGGFLAGPALIALGAAGEAAGWLLGDPEDGRALGRARRLGLTAAATLLASLLNPFHYRALLFPLHVVGDRVSQDWIIEWLSPPFTHPQVLLLEALLLLVLLLALSVERPMRWRDLVVLVPLVHLGLTATRNTPLLVIVALPIAGRLGAGWAATAWRARSRPGRLAASLAAAGALALALGLATNSRDPAGVWDGLRPRLGLAESFPEGAVAALRDAGGSGTLLNEYVWGGYLIWHLYPEYRVSIDGRMAVYGPALFAEHVAVTELQPGWRQALDRLDPVAAVLRAGTPATRALRASGWTVLHEDGIATVLRAPRAG
jgi:hypothetical protein